MGYTLAQKRKDPAKRARLPLSALTSKQQRQRKLNQRIAKDDANPLFDPTAQLSGHRLYSAARQLAGTELNPQLASIDRQSAVEGVQSRALADRAQTYYRELANREMENINRQAPLDAARAKALSDIGATTQANIDKARQQEQSIISNRDPASQGSTNVLAELDAAKASAATRQQGAETEGNAKAANTTALLQAMMQTGQLRAGETQAQLANRQANRAYDLSGKRADLESQRGALTNKSLLDLRQSGFENAATMAGLGLKRDDLAQQASTAKANRQVKYAGIRATKESKRLDRLAAKARSDERLTQSERNSLRSSGIDPNTGRPIPGGKLDPNRPKKQEKETAASLKMRRDISSGRGTWRRLMSKFGGDEAHVKKHMIETMGVPPAAYNAIYDLERTGTLHPRNARALADDLGVMVPAGWKRSLRRSAASKAPQ